MTDRGGTKGTWNFDCSSPTASGCWGHRHELLGEWAGPGCPDCIAGAGYASPAAQNWKESWRLLLGPAGRVPHAARLHVERGRYPVPACRLGNRARTVSYPRMSSRELTGRSRRCAWSAAARPVSAYMGISRGQEGYDYPWQDQSARTRARRRAFLAIIRTAIGAITLLAPSLARLWVGAPGRTAGGKILSRSLAVREIVLGGGPYWPPQIGNACVCGSRRGGWRLRRRPRHRQHIRATEMASSAGHAGLRCSRRRWRGGGGVFVWRVFRPAPISAA